MDTNVIRSYLKNAFWPNPCVRSSFQLLGILEYACGLNLGLALTLNQNPIFEMASRRSEGRGEQEVKKVRSLSAFGGAGGDQGSEVKKS
jgi:hypothetical protein